MKNTKGYALKLAGIVIALIFIAYGYYGFIYIPQNSGFGGPKCIIESFQSQQQYFKTGGACMYSMEALIIGVILLIAVIVIWWKFD